MAGRETCHRPTTASSSTSRFARGRYARGSPSGDRPVRPRPGGVEGSSCRMTTPPSHAWRAGAGCSCCPIEAERSTRCAASSFGTARSRSPSEDRSNGVRCSPSSPTPSSVTRVSGAPRRFDGCSVCRSRTILRGVLAAAAFDEIRVDVVRTTDRSPSIGTFFAPSGSEAEDRAGVGEETGLRRPRACIGAVDGSRRPADHDGNDRGTCETTVIALPLDGLEPPGVCGQLGHVAGERDHETGATVLPVFHVCGAAVKLGELLDE